jgi:2-hydroxychromene-2-carboxylate isomerase
VLVYGDFNCPYSYLASMRVDLLTERGVTVQWRAVEHDRSLPGGGSPTEPELARWRRELDDVAQLAIAGERPAAAVGPMTSNTEAAVAAYAAAFGIQLGPAVRARLFDAVWVQHRNLSDAAEVRRVLADLGPITWDSAEPSAHAEALVRQWRAEWLALSDGVVPTMRDAEGAVHPGVAALTRLAELARR